VVYNLTVANDHTYFVGVEGVLGHNSEGCTIPGNDLWDHLFRGVSRGGSQEGLHHAMFGKIANGYKFSPNTRIKYRRLKGFYETHIRKIGSKAKNDKFSTMFPNNWSETRVKQVVYKAYLISISNNRQNPIPLNLIMGEAYNGIVLQINYRKNRVDSIFPKILR